jgi:hypothetical protein
MTLTLDLNQPLEKILEKNIPPVGGRRKKRVGGEDGIPPPSTETTTPEQIEKAKPAADYAIITTLKTAFDYLITQGVKVGTAASEAGVAGAIVYAVDKLYRSDLCDPLLMSGAKLLNAVPIVGAYAMKCDNAAIAYHTAMTASMVLVTPLLVEAVKTAGRIFVPPQTVEDVAENIVEAVKNPMVAATNAISKRRASVVAPPSKALPLPGPPPKNNMFGLPTKGSSKRTKKRNMKKLKKTRRPARFFKY